MGSEMCIRDSVRSELEAKEEDTVVVLFLSLCPDVCWFELPLKVLQTCQSKKTYLSKYTLEDEEEAVTMQFLSIQTQVALTVILTQQLCAMSLSSNASFFSNPSFSTSSINDCRYVHMYNKISNA